MVCINLINFMTSSHLIKYLQRMTLTGGQSTQKSCDIRLVLIIPDFSCDMNIVLKSYAVIGFC